MPTDRATGRLVAGRYELKERLGQGGMGVVWRATDILLQRDVALKMLQIPAGLDDAGDEELREKVLREARAAARLNHPGVVTVFDVVEDGDQPVIVMELVDSPSLAELVRRQGPLSPKQAAAIAVEVLDALAAAHTKGIIHRDVKPANIMVPAQGGVRLSDFGVAALLDDPMVTTSGVVAGSPSYMAPEQATGQARGPAADLWSLGASLYFAVEGQPPFDKGGAIATLTSIVHDEPRPHRRAGALGPVLDALLVKDPGERPGTEEVRRLLTEVAGAGTEDHGNPPRAGPAGGDVASMAPTQAQAAPMSRVGGGTDRTERSFAAVAPDVGEARTEGAPTNRQRLAVPILLTAVVAVVVAVVLARPGREDGPSTSASTSTVPTSTVPTSTVPTSTAPAATPKPPSTDRRTTSSTTAAARTVPSDWVRYTDPVTGFAISYPAGWGVRTRGTLTDFTDPASGAYLRVDHVEPPGPSPEGAWLEYEPKFAAGKGAYKRIQITPTTYKGFDAAIWEFTYGEGSAARHAVDLGFVTGRYGFALNFQTRSSDWERFQPVFERFKDSFEAPRS